MADFKIGDRVHVNCSNVGEYDATVTEAGTYGVKVETKDGDTRWEPMDEVTLIPTFTKGQTVEGIPSFPRKGETLVRGVVQWQESAVVWVSGPDGDMRCLKRLTVKSVETPTFEVGQIVEGAPLYPKIGDGMLLRGRVTSIYSDGDISIKMAEGTSDRVIKAGTIKLVPAPFEKGTQVNGIITNNEELGRVTGVTTGTMYCNGNPYIKLDQAVGGFKAGDRVFIHDANLGRFYPGQRVTGIVTYFEKYGRVTGAITRIKPSTTRSEHGEQWFVKLEAGSHPYTEGTVVFIHDVEPYTEPTLKDGGEEPIKVGDRVRGVRWFDEKTPVTGIVVLGPDRAGDYKVRLEADSKAEAGAFAYPAKAGEERWALGKTLVRIETTKPAFNKGDRVTALIQGSESLGRKNFTYSHFSKNVGLDYGTLLDDEAGVWTKGAGLFIINVELAPEPVTTFKTGERVSGLLTFSEHYGRVFGTVVSQRNEDSWFIKLETKVGSFVVGNEYFIHDVKAAPFKTGDRVTALVAGFERDGRMTFILDRDGANENGNYYGSLQEGSKGWRNGIRLYIHDLEAAPSITTFKVTMSFAAPKLNYGDKVRYVGPDGEHDNLDSGNTIGLFLSEERNRTEKSYRVAWGTDGDIVSVPRHHLSKAA